MESYYSSKLAWSLVLAFAMAAANSSPCAAQNAPADFVSLHNTARLVVGAGPVTWDTTVAAYAQSYANSRKASCNLAHSNGTYGENLFWGSGTTWTASSAVTMWTDEKQYYNYATNTCALGKVCGHYTQVVWSSSTSIGCARVVCDNNAGVFIICNYSPRGNIGGQRPY
ncbi:pathogenesis-related protein PRB1-2-like [Hordeum vulgare subsp. vulgare]|uniref:SCP domain-containing protein n=1 Tax=Hordeum vulgare subsp. vulgare TaxID=112509 RepID=A0A8I6YBG7_HORVV|nr:pathogenesis-related protein PRB1-2-like [Hordeum vulgare subsp. vulgare]